MATLNAYRDIAAVPQNRTTSNIALLAINYINVSITPVAAYLCFKLIARTLHRERSQTVPMQA
jgi:hypothetical protein